jgi:hypothetical protein
MPRIEVFTTTIIIIIKPKWELLIKATMSLTQRECLLGEGLNTRFQKATSDKKEAYQFEVHQRQENVISLHCTFLWISMTSLQFLIQSSLITYTLPRILYQERFHTYLQVPMSSSFL